MKITPTSVFCFCLAAATGCVAQPSSDLATQRQESLQVADASSDASDADTDDPTLCCVCSYGNNPACGRCTAAGRRSCEAESPDCNWFNGRCMDRHQEDCITWMRERGQRDCDRKITVERGDAPDLNSCDEIRWKDDGHGCGLDDHDPRVTACIESGACSTTFGLGGCSEFGDMDEVDEWIRGLQRRLGEGQTLTVSGNQCTSSNACQAGRCSVTVTCDDIEVELPACDEECYSSAEGQTAQCGDADNPQTGVCCCTGRDCHFQVGTSCGDGGASDAGTDGGTRDSGAAPDPCRVHRSQRACMTNKASCGAPTSCAWGTPSGPCFTP